MKRYSKKRQERNAEAEPVRAALRELPCDRCQNRRHRRSVHEIGWARGGKRAKALDQTCSLLVLCESNPATGKLGCHSIVQNWKEPKELALLMLSRPGTYDLKAHLELTSPNAPRRITQDEVDEAADEILGVK